jgi:hypothetical protein
MNRRFWRCAVGVAAALGVAVPAALAWACVGLMSLTVSAASVAPGGTVTVFGKEFAQGAPVDIHLDSATGPVLATAPAPTDTMTSQFNVRVTIPANVPTGQHVLVATQAYHYMNSGAPARATIYVGTAAPAPAEPGARPANVVFDSGPSGASLALMGFAVAAVLLLVAGLWSLAATRRQARPEAATVS